MTSAGGRAPRRNRYGHDVHRWNGISPTGYVRLTPAPVTTAAFTDSPASSRECYWYQIVAVDDADGSQPTLPVRVMVGTASPPAPIGIKAVPVEGQGMRVSWTTVIDVNDESDIAGYDVLPQDPCRDHMVGPAAKRRRTCRGPVHHRTRACSCLGTVLQYRVEAVDAAGRKSSFSSIVTVALSGARVQALGALRRGRLTGPLHAAPAHRRRPRTVRSSTT